MNEIIKLESGVMRQDLEEGLSIFFDKKWVDFINYHEGKKLPPQHVRMIADNQGQFSDSKLFLVKSRGHVLFKVETAHRFLPACIGETAKVLLQFFNTREHLEEAFDILQEVPGKELTTEEAFAKKLDGLLETGGIFGGDLLNITSFRDRLKTEIAEKKDNPKAATPFIDVLIRTLDVTSKDEGLKGIVKTTKYTSSVGEKRRLVSEYGERLKRLRRRNENFDTIRVLQIIFKNEQHVY